MAMTLVSKTSNQGSSPCIYVCTHSIMVSIPDFQSGGASSILVACFIAH